MTTVNLHAARTHFSRLVDAAAAGEEIIITRAGKPVARLAPLASPEKRPKRQLGLLAGRATIPADCDAPLPESVLDDFERR